MKPPALRRKSYDLTEAEREELDHLRDAPGAAFSFWRRVAAPRDLDPRTILAHPGFLRSKFTALPKGHGKWWCWPGALECRQKVKDGHPLLTGMLESA